MTAALRVENLSGGYLKAPILRDVTMVVEEGEVVALFGANGAGKTTLLRALCGALPVCRGTVMLGDQRVDGLRTWTRARMGLAHVPEGREIFVSMTVRENLETAALAARRPTSIEDVFSLFPRLRERQAQRAGTLSGGEQQMLALGRAVMAGPSVMLIDEMSAGLAPLAAQHLVETVRDIRGRGVAVVLVEQAPQLVSEVIDRAYLIERGAIVAGGTLEELGGATAIAELYLGVG